MHEEMEECKAVLRQHLEDSRENNSNVSSHCLNHFLNSTEGYTCPHEFTEGYICTHEHTECDICMKPFAALALIDFMITKVCDTKRQKMFKREHEMHLRNILFMNGTHKTFCCPKTNARCNRGVNGRKHSFAGGR